MGDMLTEMATNLEEANRKKGKAIKCKLLASNCYIVCVEEFVLLEKTNSDNDPSHVEISYSQGLLCKLVVHFYKHSMHSVILTCITRAGKLIEQRDNAEHIYTQHFLAWFLISHNFCKTKEQHKKV